MVQLRIELVDVEPVVWRRLLVPGSVRMSKLHAMIQAAMGWTNSHLHCFTVGEDRYGMQFDDFPEGEIDESSVTVLSALRGREGFGYEYDFGDGWDHQVTIERVVRFPSGLKLAVCLDGANACPPEDCGGAWGYRHLREVLADRAHPDHAELVRWIGEPFDPAAFDIAAANTALQPVR